jgi:hypothetical protein
MVQYAMLVNHPNLAFTVGMLSKHATTPGQEHCTTLKRVYYYLHGTTNAHLVFRGDVRGDLLGYIDADWAADINDQ